MVGGIMRGIYVGWSGGIHGVVIGAVSGAVYGAALGLVWAAADCLPTVAIDQAVFEADPLFLDIVYPDIDSILLTPESSLLLHELVNILPERGIN